MSSAVNRKQEAADKEVFCVTSNRVLGSDNSHLVDIDTLCCISVFVLVCRLSGRQEISDLSLVINLTLNLTINHGKKHYQYKKDSLYSESCFFSCCTGLLSCIHVFLQTSLSVNPA